MFAAKRGHVGVCVNVDGELRSECGDSIKGKNNNKFFFLYLLHVVMQQLHSFPYSVAVTSKMKHKYKIEAIGC